jgi:hypothetical protein
MRLGERHMSCLSSYAAIAVTVVASTLASPAFANVITFETAPLGGFTSPVTENGFTYSKLSGGLEVDGLGNPGHDMAGAGGVALFLGGVLKIVSATGGDFTFDSIDFSAFQSTSPTGSQTLVVKGLLDASTVGMDTYTLANTNDIPYTNWTTELASVLAGKTLSELDITLNAGLHFTESIDNVVLTPVATPEPASLALLGAGVLALGWVRRRRKA